MSPVDEDTVLRALEDSKHNTTICIHTLNCLHAFCLGLLDTPNLVGLLNHLLTDSDHDISSFSYSVAGKSPCDPPPRIQFALADSAFSKLSNVLDCRKLVRNNKGGLTSHSLTSSASSTLALSINPADDPLDWAPNDVVSTLSKLQSEGATALILAAAERKTWVSDAGAFKAGVTAQDVLAILGLCHLPIGTDPQSLTLLKLEFDPSSFVKELYRPCPIDGVNLRHRAFPRSEPPLKSSGIARTFGMTVNIDSSDFQDGALELIHIPRDSLKATELTPGGWSVVLLGSIAPHSSAARDAEYAKALWDREDAHKLVGGSMMSANVKAAYAALFP